MRLTGEAKRLFARYAPFGALLWQQGTAPGPWGFAGEMQDPTGLIYLRARWYDSATGRFLTRDPVPGVPMLPASLNPYVYALNNPVLYTDPSGEFAFVTPLLLGAAIGGGLAAYNYWQAQPCATFPSALSDPGFLRAVGIGLLSGAVGGLIGFGVGAVSAGAFGGGLMGAVITRAVGGTVGFGVGGLTGGAGCIVTEKAAQKLRNPRVQETLEVLDGSTRPPERIRLQVQPEQIGSYVFVKPLRKDA